MPTIKQDNPFNFPSSPGWTIGQGGPASGGDDTYDSLQVGGNNTADSYFSGFGGSASSSPFNGSGSGGFIGNGGGGSGPDVYGDVTVVNTAVGFNATFAGDNIFPGLGSIGLFGRSRGLGTTANNPNFPPPPPPPPALGTVSPGASSVDLSSGLNDWSIGVLGQSSKGCGMYGLATDDSPSTLQPSHGIGVVGRSVGGQAVENMSVEQVMGWVSPTVPANANDGAIGVLGQSLNGPGVRGHGGPLQRVTPETPEKQPSQANPGGVFSSGRRQYFEIGSNPLLSQEVSLDSRAQLRLAPSIDARLPEIAKIGDLFLQLVNPLGNLGSERDNEKYIPPAANLWICTGYEGTGLPLTEIPRWQRVLLAPAVPGGTIIPPPTS
jgi:hypothetical protein